MDIKITTGRYCYGEDQAVAYEIVMALRSIGLDVKVDGELVGIQIGSDGLVNNPQEDRTGRSAGQNILLARLRSEGLPIIVEAPNRRHYSR